MRKHYQVYLDALRGFGDTNQAKHLRVASCSHERTFRCQKLFLDIDISFKVASSVAILFFFFFPFLALQF